MESRRHLFFILHSEFFILNLYGGIAMFVLLVQFVAREGTEESVLELMRRMEEHTRQEPGCQLYIGSQSNENPRKFCFYEQYADETALAAHRAAPYFAQYVTNGLSKLMESREQETFTTISS